MIGCYDFCGHYDWTFHWIAEQGGKELLYQYWDEAIRCDSQKHAADLILSKGVAGMEEYWGHTLSEEAPDGGYSAGAVGDRFWLEMTDCPSRGFLLRNGIDFSGDYCDHCIGWGGPLMRDAGFTVNHAHNHGGQCFWEYLPADNIGKSEPLIEASKAELMRRWTEEKLPVDCFEHANDARNKIIK